LRQNVQDPDRRLRELELERLRLHDEIRDYPQPIPACDEHFNHLLEERARVARELARLRAHSD
jgi:chorismate mutase